MLRTLNLLRDVRPLARGGKGRFFTVSAMASSCLVSAQVWAANDKGENLNFSATTPRAKVARSNVLRLEGANAESSGVKLLTEMQREVLSVGEPIYLNVTLDNGSDKPLLIGSNDASSFQFSLKDANGVELPSLTSGKRSRWSGSYSMEYLPVGSKRRYQFCLSRMFDLSMSGRYTVIVRRDVTTGYLKLPKGNEQAQRTMASSSPQSFTLVETPSSGARVEPFVASPREHQYLYVLNSYNSHGVNQPTIARYLIGDDGRVSPTLDQPTKTDGGARLLVDNRRHTAYVLDGGTTSISQLRIGVDGILSPLLPKTLALSFPSSTMEVDASSSWIWVATNHGAIPYRINPDGTLTMLPQYPSSGNYINQVVLSPDGKYLYTDNIGQYRIQADKSVTPLEPAHPPYKWDDIFKTIAIDSRGQYLYALMWQLESRTSRQSVQAIVTFKINADGTLVRLPSYTTPRFPYNSGRDAKAFRASGDYLYVLNVEGSAVTIFKIHPSGELTLVPESPAQNIGSNSGSPIALAFDATHRFAYTAKRSFNGIGQYRVNAQGQLVSLGLDVPSGGLECEDLAVATASTSDPKGLIKGGLQLSARLPQEVFRPDDPLTLTVTLKNVTKQPIDLGDAFAELSCLRFIVRSETGKTIPLSAYGKSLMAVPTIHSSPPNILLGGQSRQYCIPLQRICSFGGSGYTLQVQRVPSPNSSLADVMLANSLRFRIDSLLGGLTGDYTSWLPQAYRYVNGIGVPFEAEVNAKAQTHRD